MGWEGSDPPPPGKLKSIKLNKIMIVKFRKLGLGPPWKNFLDAHCYVNRNIPSTN